jgi:urea transporter
MNGTWYRAAAAATIVVGVVVNTAIYIGEPGGPESAFAASNAGIVLGSIICMRMARSAKVSAWWVAAGYLGVLAGPLVTWAGTRDYSRRWHKWAAVAGCVVAVVIVSALLSIWRAKAVQS